MNKELQLERERRKTYVHSRLADSLVNVTGSIPFQLVISFAAIEALQAVEVGKDKRRVFGDVAGSMLEGGLIAGGFLEALAKSGAITEMIKQGGAVAEKAGGYLAQAAPLLLAAGAAA